MKFSGVILALAAAASTSAQSVDGAQATLSLFAVLPSSIANLALTNPSAAATVIVSEFATGTPAWFTSLPTAVQSYFVTQLGGGDASSAASAAASITGSVGPLATGSSGLVSNVTSAIYNNASSIRSSASSRASSIRASASSAASGAASSASSAAGAMQTVVSFGAAGIAGLAAILAL